MFPNRERAEVAQLYVSNPVSPILHPEKELKAFEKVFLQPGQAKTVELDIKDADIRKTLLKIIGYGLT